MLQTVLTTYISNFHCHYEPVCKMMNSTTKAILMVQTTKFCGKQVKSDCKIESHVPKLPKIENFLTIICTESFGLDDNLVSCLPPVHMGKLYGWLPLFTK